MCPHLRLSPCHSAPATLASSVSLEHTRHTSAPGHYTDHSLCPERSSRDLFWFNSLTSFKPLLISHLLNDVYPEHPVLKVEPHPPQTTGSHYPDLPSSSHDMYHLPVCYIMCFLIVSCVPPHTQNLSSMRVGTLCLFHSLNESQH